MADEDWYKPNRPPTPPRQPKPGELLFEFYVEATKKFYRCELRDHGATYGVEAQFFDPVELIMARRFDRCASIVRGTVELGALEIRHAPAEEFAAATRYVHNLIQQSP